MLILVHLTDIHIHDDSDLVLTRAAKIGAAISSHSAGATLIAVLITGDIAYSGSKAQYDLARVFLEEIQSRVKLDCTCPIKFIIVPGNHDCDYTSPQEIRNIILQKLADEPASTPSPELLGKCIAVQDNFFEFYEDINGHHIAKRERLRYTDEATVEGEIIYFDCLNVAWVSQLGDARVTFPPSILPDRKENDGCVITLLHHPFNWLHPSSYREFRRKVRTHADFIFSGHEHNWNITEIDDQEAGRCIHFEGHVLQEPGSPRSGFTIVEVNLATHEYRSFEYHWSEGRYQRELPGNWSHFRRFEVTTRQDAWELSGEFRRELDDLGITLHVGRKAEVSLSDVFIAPDIARTHGDDKSNPSLDVDHLIVDQANSSGFVLQGDERSGRSTLLKHLVERFVQRGCTPILIVGNQVRRATEQELERCLDERVAHQYGRSYSDYLQLPKAQRVCLLDDFDELSIKSGNARSQLLERLEARFGVLVLSVSEAFDVACFAPHGGSKIYDTLPGYRILPFGSLNRTRLISRP